MSKSPSFQMLVPKISRIAPLKSVIYVGDREAGDIQNYLSEQSSKLIVACHNVQKKESFTGSSNDEKVADNPYLHHVLCSNFVGKKTYYETSLVSETGLVDPVFLKKYWKNVSVKSETDRDVTTLDNYFLNSAMTSVTSDVTPNELSWLVIDMLSAGDILLGATSLLEKTSCVAVKTLFDDTADAHLENSTFAGISNILTRLGFIFYDEVKYPNPNLGFSFFLKDWKAVAKGLNNDNERLNVAHNDISVSLAQLDAEHSELKSERDELELAHTQAVETLAHIDTKGGISKIEHDKLAVEHEVNIAALTDLQSVHAVLMKERDSLVITHQNIAISLTQLSETHDALKNEHNELNVTHDALKREHNALNVTYQENLASLKQLNEMHSALEVERDNLETARRAAVGLAEQVESATVILKDERDNLDVAQTETLASLTKLEHAHNALKTERDTLQVSHNEALTNISDLNNVIAQLKDNEDTIAALMPEFTKVKDELTALRKNSSTMDEVDELSKTLGETTRSLKISTQLQLKKDADLRGLEEKYSDLVKMTDTGDVEKITASTHEDPIRIIHHLSCTGGTLFAKCLAAQPNILLLNEVDPLSTMLVNTKKAEFTPTDLIGLIRQADTQVDQDMLTDVFLDGLKVVKRHVTSKGMTLIGRDHSHGKYLTGDVVADRPSFKDITLRQYEAISLVTVRHPIDSFLSLQKNGWDQHFTPSTLDEYCKRYLTFLDDMSDVDIIRYEDFIDNPKDVMRKMCLILKISYNNDFMDIFDAFTFSGASGRSNGEIAKRPRRDVNDVIMAEVDSSKAYATLISRLEY